MMAALALAPTFAKGVIAVVAALILFVGSVYVILTAIFGPRMASLVLAVSFFGWMILYSTSGRTNLLAAHASVQAGGPDITVFAYHDSGNVQVYSWSFFGASLVLFLIHLPFLDRAERKRKAILTGGTAPPWYGPA